MSKTMMLAGQAALIFTDDGQGRRVSAGCPKNGIMRDPVILALNKRELREVIAKLRGLVDELPDP